MQIVGTYCVELNLSVEDALGTENKYCPSLRGVLIAEVKLNENHKIGNDLLCPYREVSS
jgi:hypothetical protein